MFFIEKVTNFAIRLLTIVACKQNRNIMTKGLSKSRYTAFCQCPKNLWLKVFEPEKATKDPALEARFEQGNMVGDLAMQLFGDYVDVTTIDADNHLDLTAMVDKTQREMVQGTENICEASFARDGLNLH